MLTTNLNRMSSLILHQHQQQYLDEGYFILESALSGETLDLLRDACDLLIDRMHIEMDRLKTDHIHISHRNQRYHIAKQYDAIDGLEKYVFGDVMACLLYTSPSPRDQRGSRMPSSA